ncbi:ribonuclease H-like domain-containing protein [Tanacetum coccineum]
MWLFRHKYLAYGPFSRYKARLIANGSMQLEVHQLGVKNAFLHDALSETVYMHQPPGFWDSAHPDYRHGTDTAYLLLYVDDIVLTASFEILLQQIIASLHQEFYMTNLGLINYFLGISVTRDSLRMFLSQRKYATEILERDHMVNFNPCRTPVGTESKLGDDGDPVSDLTLLAPRYFIGLVALLLGDLLLVIVCGNNLLSWSSKCQPMLSQSSAEAEYRGVAKPVAENCWLRNLLRELHTTLSSATLVYCDNVRVLHVPSRYQYADIFTKGLRSALFEEFRSSLSVRCPPAQTAVEC